MKSITVITTTYNRRYCLHQVYESLLRQTSDDFIWLIVDDGSSDHTDELVEEWKCENKIEIEYFYKRNGGMHTARNLAYEKVHTELNVIIDSDDWMTDDAVEKIVAFWKDNKDERYYGIITDNISKAGELVSSASPKDVLSTTITDLFGKYGVVGDKKLVLRSDLSKKYPYPEFQGEKFYPASYKFFMLDKDYQMLIFPHPTCVVDYNPDSMTYDKYAQYRSCPKGFAHYSNEVIQLSNSWKVILKEEIRYIAESKFAGNQHYISAAAKPLLTFFMLPIGCVWFLYLNHTKRKY